MVVCGTPVQTGAPAGAKGGSCCKLDQLCSVYLSRLVRACVKLSNLFTWSVLTMPEDDPGLNDPSASRDELEHALNDANATLKRTSEALNIYLYIYILNIYCIFVQARSSLCQTLLVILWGRLN